MFEAFFLALVSSPAALELSLSIVGNAATVGALAPDAGGMNVLTPLFAAAATIAFSGSKFFAGIERGTLQFAYGVAGIPGDLDAVLRSMSGKTFIAQLKGDSDLSKAAHLDPARNSPLHRLTDEEQTLHLLYVLMYGKGSGRHLPVAAETVLIQCRREMEDLYFNARSMRREREEIRAESVMPAGEDDEAVGPEGMVAKDREAVVSVDGAIEGFLRLLAILLVKCEESASDLDRSTPLGRIAGSVLAEPENAFFPGVTRIALASVVRGFAIALTVVSLCYLGQYLIHDIRPSLLLFDSRTESILVRGLPTDDYLISIYRMSFTRALWEAAGVGLIFLVVVLVVFATRFSSASRPSANGAPRRSTSLLDSASVAVLSVVVALSVYFALLFFKIVVLPQVFVRSAAHSASLLNDFGAIYLPHALFAVLAAPVALAVCRIYDELAAEKPVHRHSRVALGTAWRYALYAGLVNLAIQLLVDTVSSVDEMLWSVSYPGGYVLIYLLVYRSAVLHAAPEFSAMRELPSSLPESDTSVPVEAADTESSGGVEPGNADAAVSRPGND